MGLCGLVCGTVLESTSVLLSDKEPFALHCALSSAAAAVDRAPHDTPSPNQTPLPSRIQGAVLDWCDDTLTTYDNTAEVILASDVLYDTTSIDAFATICHRLLRWRTRPQDPVSSATAATSSSSSSSSSNSVMLLVTDPKIERTVGARKQFTERLLSIFQPKNDDDKNPNGNDTTNTTKMTIEIDVLDLPSIPTTSSPCSTTAADTIGTTTTSDEKRQQQQQHEEEEGITFDGKDHYKRMKEDTVLIRCIITIV